MSDSKKTKIPAHLMPALRGCFNVKDTEHDTRRDKAIEKLSPAAIVCELTAWCFCDASLARQIAAWMLAVGARPEDF